MKMDSNSRVRERLSRLISIGIVVVAVALGLGVLWRSTYYPRTDDAEVFANFIDAVEKLVAARVASLSTRRVERFENSCIGSVRVIPL